MDVLLALPPETDHPPRPHRAHDGRRRVGEQRVRARLARPGPRGRRAVHRARRARHARAARRRLRRRPQGLGPLARRARRHRPRLAGSSAAERRAATSEATPSARWRIGSRRRVAARVVERPAAAAAIETDHERPSTAASSSSLQEVRVVQTGVAGPVRVPADRAVLGALRRDHRVPARRVLRRPRVLGRGIGAPDRADRRPPDSVPARPDRSTWSRCPTASPSAASWRPRWP